MDILNWVLKYGNDLTIITFLLLTIVAVLLGLYKQWWVPGWVYKKEVVQLETKLKRLEERTDAEAERTRIRLEVYEEQERSRMGQGRKE